MKKKFTKEECEQLVYEEVVDVDYHENRRWVRGVTTIIEYNGKYYSIQWSEALTESQEDEFWDQEAEEVELKEVQVTTKRWEVV